MPSLLLLLQNRHRTIPYAAPAHHRHHWQAIPHRDCGLRGLRIPAICTIPCRIVAMRQQRMSSAGITPRHTTPHSTFQPLSNCSDASFHALDKHRATLACSGGMRDTPTRERRALQVVQHNLPSRRACKQWPLNECLPLPDKRWRMVVLQQPTAQIGYMCRTNNNVERTLVHIVLRAHCFPTPAHAGSFQWHFATAA